MSKCSFRTDQKELMDDLNSTGHVLEQTLRELRVINKMLGGNKVTITGIEQLLKGILPHQAITIADIGCGHGDMLVAIADQFSHNFSNMRLLGIDANPYIVDKARKNTAQYPQITYKCIDVLTEAFRVQTYDIITCSLFTHHFNDRQLVNLLASFKKQAVLGVVVNDLHRHWLAYHSIKVLVKVFSKSPMVQHDAPLSVLRAFRKRDIKDILTKAGIHDYTLKWMWAFRWQLVF